MEENYEFRKRLREVHQPNRLNPELQPESSECIVDKNWVIVLSNNCGSDKVAQTAAMDLHEYFLTSMGVTIPVRRESAGAKEIRLDLDEKVSKRPDAFLLHVEAGMIKIAAKTGKGLFGGTIYIEDLMNLREAPFLKCGDVLCEPPIEARGVHSGFGLDMFPDCHLNAIAHAGFNEIYLFVRGIGKCANSYCDIQDLIDRAERYGLDVMFYCYISGYKHPEEPDAMEYFESTFGDLFKHYPKAKGITLVGESAEFPSRDPATTGKRWHESLWHGIPDPRPSPGWWPCSDYPAWISMVGKAIRKYKPDAKITFSTYNWLWTPAEKRRKFLENLPKDIQVRIPFEMFKQRNMGNGACRQVMDYTISETEFSECCREEMQMAHELGLRIGVTSIAGGTPWDFGTVPYVPAPFQWIRKFNSLLAAKEKYGADNFYDSHHMGWWPSIVTDLGRAAFRQPETDLETLLRKLTVRDYGKAASDGVMDAWRLWSDAMTFHVPSNENQYGPFRVGSSYPLVFHPNVTRTMTSKEIKFPASESAYFGGRILKTFFQPFENSGQSPYPFRRKSEMASLAKMLELWNTGIKKLIAVENSVPGNKRYNYEQLLNIVKFIECFIVTGINVHKWYDLNMKLLNAEDLEQAIGLLDEIEKLAKSEIVNAQNAIEYVDADSRLGWEPSMEYMTDRWHLEWKIKQVRTMIDGDIGTYRKMIELGK